MAAYGIARIDGLRASGSDTGRQAPRQIFGRRCRARIRCCVMAGSVWRRTVSGSRPLSFGVGGPSGCGG